jgi:hypothetical protein
MKRTILTLTIAMAALLSPALVSHISAQSDFLLEVKIPFAFSICNEQLPAGKYTLKHASSSSTHWLAIRSEDNRIVELACTNDMQSPKNVEQGRLVFNRYGDQYFLAEAWWPSDNVGHEIVKSEREKSLIKELSGDSSKRAKTSEKVIIKFAKPKKSN